MASHFQRLEQNTKQNHSVFHSSKTRIDVIPDTRFVASYVSWHVLEQSRGNHKFQESIIGAGMSDICLAGYCLSVFYAYILYCDVTHRHETSFQAQEFLQDQKACRLYRILCECKIPDFLANLLKQFVPAHDSSIAVSWCPSLAGFSFAHDFGRVLPPSLYYTAHDELCRSGVDVPRDSAWAEFMNAKIYEINGYCRAKNLLNSSFGNAVTVGSINKSFLTLFHGCCVAPRDSLSSFLPEKLGSFNACNVYKTLLLCSRDNYGMASSLYRRLSNLYGHDLDATQSISSLGQSSSKIIMNCTIEPPTLPTWSWFRDSDSGQPTPAKLSEAIECKGRDAYELAKHYGFITRECEESSEAREFYSIDHRRNVFYDRYVYPRVLYAQPPKAECDYNAHTLVLGIKMEVCSHLSIKMDHELETGSRNSLYPAGSVKLSQVQAVLFEESSYQNSQRFPDNERWLLLNDARAIEMESEYDTSDPISSSPKLWAWSSYRVVPDDFSRPTEDSVAMLVTYRDMYGATLPLYNLAHPTEAFL